MPYHLLQRREDKAQIFYQPDECFTLRFRSCVGRPAVPVQSANVADADRPMVPTRAMRSVESNISSRFYRTVETDDEMITDRTKTTLTMPAVDVGSGKSCPARVAEQWMMIVSFMAESSFPVCRRQVR